MKRGTVVGGKAMPAGSSKLLSNCVLVAIIYGIAVQFALLFPDTAKVTAVIWPAAGIGLATLLLSSRKSWGMYLLAMFIGGNVSNLAAGRPLFGSVGFMLANCMESYASALLIVRLCGESVQFNRVRQILALITSATVVNAATAVIGALTAVVVSQEAFSTFYPSWWMADGFGILLVTPLIVAWRPRQFSPPLRTWASAVEPMLFLAVWITVAALVFSPDASSHPYHAHPYLLVALLAWPALRLGQKSVTTGLALLALVAISSGSVAIGPSPLGGVSQQERLLLIQGFLAIISSSGLLLAATYQEARAAEQLASDNAEKARGNWTVHLACLACSLWKVELLTPTGLRWI